MGVPRPGALRPVCGRAHAMGAPLRIPGGGGSGDPVDRDHASRPLVPERLAGPGKETGSGVPMPPRASQPGHMPGVAGVEPASPIPLLPGYPGHVARVERHQRPGVPVRHGEGERVPHRARPRGRVRAWEPERTLHPRVLGHGRVAPVADAIAREAGTAAGRGEGRGRLLRAAAHDDRACPRRRPHAASGTLAGPETAAPDPPHLQISRLRKSHTLPAPLAASHRISTAMPSRRPRECALAMASSPTTPPTPGPVRLTMR